MGTSLSLKRETDRALISECLARGLKSPNAIADAINQHRSGFDLVDIGFVTREIAEVKKQLRTRQDQSREEWTDEIVHSLQYALSETFIAWEESKKDEITIEYDEIVDEAQFNEMPTNVGKIDEEQLFLRKAKIKSRKRDGNPAHMANIAKLIHQIAQIQGVLAPTKIAHTDSKGNDLKISPLDALTQKLESFNKAKTPLESE